MEKISPSSARLKPSDNSALEKLAETELLDVERHACPGAGSCGGMFTANTMSSAIEAMGMSLPHSSTMTAAEEEKLISTGESARTLSNAIRNKLLPRQIMTRKAFENAIAVVMATGGSTNAVLHLLAMSSLRRKFRSRLTTSSRFARVCRFSVT